MCASVIQKYMIVLCILAMLIYLRIHVHEYQKKKLHMHEYVWMWFPNILHEHVGWIFNITNGLNKTVIVSLELPKTSNFFFDCKKLNTY